jgi:hypothetical protein
MTTAMWLLFAPLLGLESGARADLVLVVGALAFAASVASVWWRPARPALVVLGAVIGFANFGLDASIGSLSSLAACAVGLIAAGTAPYPVTDVITAAAEATAARTELPSPPAARGDAGDDFRSAA